MDDYAHTLDHLQAAVENIPTDRLRFLRSAATDAGTQFIEQMNKQLAVSLFTDEERLVIKLLTAIASTKFFTIQECASVVSSDDGTEISQIFGGIPEDVAEELKVALRGLQENGLEGLVRALHGYHLAQAAGR